MLYKSDVLIQHGGHHASFWDSQGKPKSNQNDTPNESRFEPIFKSEKHALQEPLGTVLGRSWDILEAILGYEKVFSYLQTNTGVKFMLLMLISFQFTF